MDKRTWLDDEVTEIFEKGMREPQVWTGAVHMWATGVRTGQVGISDDHKMPQCGLEGIRQLPVQDSVAQYIRGGISFKKEIVSNTSETESRW